MKDKLSPEQISGRLRVNYPDEVLMRVCHETIYQALYSSNKSTLKRSLVSAIRTGRTARKRRRKANQGGFEWRLRVAGNFCQGIASV